MTSTEIKTITDALELKQTWIRKGFLNFLDIWKKQTEDMQINGSQKIPLFETGDSAEAEDEYLYYLEINSTNIYRAKKNQYNGIFENDLCYGYYDIKSTRYFSIKFIKKIISLLLPQITKFFKNKQTEIDTLSDSGKILNDLISKLS